MPLRSTKVLAVALWIAFIAVTTFLLQPASVPTWVVLASLAIVPPVVMIRYLNRRESMSESIQKVLR